jgi:hypothetical protein
MRIALILLAFIAGGAVPIQVVTLSFGYAQYIRQEALGPKVIRTAHEFAAWYIPWVYVPALVVLILIIFGTYRRYPDMCRRIVSGLCAGAIATLALDAVRQAGVIHGWLPGDTPVMFGKMATGSNNFGVFYPVGQFVHYFNGANFGLFYAFVWGRQESNWAAAGWATVWALLIELGMMLGPPMGPMVGVFGSRFAWPQLFLVTLVAHVAFGIALGLLSQSFLTGDDRGGLLRFLRGPCAVVVE